MKQSIKREHLTFLIYVIGKDTDILILRLKSPKNTNLPFMGEEWRFNVCRIYTKIH